MKARLDGLNFQNIMAASSSRLTEKEYIFTELVNNVNKDIPIEIVYNEEDVDMFISDCRRSVPVNTVNTCKNQPTTTPQVSTKQTQSDAQKTEEKWGKSLASLPAFGMKEIEAHRKNSGKTPESSIIKTRDRRAIRNNANS